jgi:hypothetical protein
MIDRECHGGVLSLHNHGEGKDGEWNTWQAAGDAGLRYTAAPTGRMPAPASRGSLTLREGPSLTGAGGASLRSACPGAGSCRAPRTARRAEAPSEANPVGAGHHGLFTQAAGSQAAGDAIRLGASGTPHDARARIGMQCRANGGYGFRSGAATSGRPRLPMPAQQVVAWRPPGRPRLWRASQRHAAAGFATRSFRRRTLYDRQPLLEAIAELRTSLRLRRSNRPAQAKAADVGSATGLVRDTTILNGINLAKLLLRVRFQTSGAPSVPGKVAVDGRAVCDKPDPTGLICAGLPDR